VTWQRFERAAESYEGWYETPRGRRASRGEKALLARLLEGFPSARTALDVGCGTGHFTIWLSQRGIAPIGLDRSPSMLAGLRRRMARCPVLLADAEALPLRDRAVDLVVFVTTLEFLDDARRALAQAVRVARLGVVVLALNRWSAGGLSRRVGPASRGALLRYAHDLSLPSLRRLVREAAGVRLARIRSGSALLPRPLPAGSTRLPIGDVVGVAATLRTE
jgi:ubiquinone/menaquinone biosynthesis C-methylase UbiE